jgi:class 3 adenylate cyclase
MKCPKCEYDNPPGARFCGDCGTPVGATRRCPHCGSLNPAAQRFCNGCGATVGADPDPPAAASLPSPPRSLADKILGARGALEGARKQVTILFADVKSSLELAEHADAEQWYRIMDRCFAILSEGVHRFEGTINQYTGDGVMALFGAPIAHEDHAERACHAALRLRGELRGFADEVRLAHGLNFSVRMGLNSGEVVVGRIGDDLHMDYTALGAVVGIASRMEQLAEPGSVLVAEETARLVRGFFQLRELGEVRVKGVAAPVLVSVLEDVGGLKTRFDRSRARGLSSFVGREQERGVLEAALQEARSGRGLVVGIAGEAGVGKSRLCHEFVQHCRASGISVAESYCLAYGRSVPFFLSVRLLRGLLDLDERDDARRAREKITGRVLLIDRDLEEDLPLVFDFLDVPAPDVASPRIDPEARRRRLFTFVTRLVLGWSAREPLVVRLEDLHWADAASLVLVRELIASLEGLHVLCVATFRPEFEADWQQRAGYRGLALEPLAPETGRRLAASLLGSDETVRHLPELIHDRTGGNPFFIEEVVASLSETGTLVGERGAYRLRQPIERQVIPSSVQAVLAARIDRLGARDKTVLEAAAVVGRRVPLTLLARVMEEDERATADTLQRLVAADFLYQEDTAAGSEYVFKHVLTQEVAYRSQLAAAREQRHAIVAAALQALHATTVGEHTALVAYHSEVAGNPLEAARWHGHAAVWAGAKDRAEALRHWKQVRTLLADVPESEETVQLGLLARFSILSNGPSQVQSEAEMASIFAEGQALAQRVGGDDWPILLLLMYGLARHFAGALSDALARLRESVRLARQKGDPFFEFIACGAMVDPLLAAGELREGLTMATRAVELGSGGLDAVDYAGFSPYTAVTILRGTVLVASGEIAAGRAEIQRGLALAQARQEVEAQAIAYADLVALAEFTGETEGVLDFGARAVELAEKCGNTLSRADAHGALGQAQRLTGQLDDAVKSLTFALALIRERRTGLHAEAKYLAQLALVYLARADMVGATTSAQRAMAVARQQQTRLQLLSALLAHVRILLAMDSDVHEDIDGALDEGLALVGETGAQIMAPFLRAERAELLRLRGNVAGRAAELREAARLFEQMGAPVHARRLEAVA